MKLTETQAKILTPLIANKNNADQALLQAICLIVGKEINSYKIENGILTVEEKNTSPNGTTQ